MSLKYLKCNRNRKKTIFSLLYCRSVCTVTVRELEDPKITSFNTVDAMALFYIRESELEKER